jgi:hypothetical protein
MDWDRPWWKSVVERQILPRSRVFVLDPAA